MRVVRVSDSWTKKAFELRVANFPDTCPICHHAVEPEMIGGVTTDRDAENLDLGFQCVRNVCRSLFIGSYRRVTVGRDQIHMLQRTAPRTPLPVDVPGEIADLSRDFVVIVNQAEAATAAELDQLTGIALRKALEFLVKDFATHEHPDEADQIRKKFLGVCIREYIDDEKVKACATRAAWLGNDEAHYTRRWEEKDIDDLRILIQLTMNWIHNVLLTRKYQAEMPD